MLTRPKVVVAALAKELCLQEYCDIVSLREHSVWFFERCLSREMQHCFQVERLREQIEHVRLLHAVSSFQQSA